jgi:ubiquinone/menaquinone biosynthesis C-methylase UbiE
MSDVMQFDEAAARRLEAVYLTPDVVAQRCAQLRVLEPRTGERIVDVGCGTGLFVSDLAQIVGPAGRVLGLDISPDVLALARRRCTDWPWVACVQGDATALPAADGEFDVAVSVQVLEYVAEVDRALAELQRVLRPGGRVLVVDSDWDAFVLSADDEVLQARILATWRAHAAHQRLPRSLAPRLRRSGFELVRRELLPMFGTSLNPHSFVAGIVHFICAFVVKSGVVSEGEAAAWLEDLRGVDRRGDLLFLLPRFLFLATKPR